MLNCAHLENERKGAAACRPSFARYAIYFTPQPGTALAAFGRSWFGRANDGITLQAFSDAGLSGTELREDRCRAWPLYAVCMRCFGRRSRCATGWDQRR